VSITISHPHHPCAPGAAHGEGPATFGGTWYVLAASGSPVTSSHPQSGTSPSAGSGGGGYGY
jgi:hypothetical protein